MSNPYIQQPGPGPMGPGPGGHMPRKKTTDPLALTSVILGAISILGSLFLCVPLLNCIACFVTPVIAIAAIVCGFIAVANNSPQKGLAWTGIGCGFGSFVIYGLLIILSMVFQIGGFAMQQPPGGGF